MEIEYEITASERWTGEGAALMLRCPICCSSLPIDPKKTTVREIDAAVMRHEARPEHAAMKTTLANKRG